MNVKDSRFICSVYINVESILKMVMNLTGQSLEKQALWTKYCFELSIEDLDKNIKRLTN